VTIAHPDSAGEVIGNLPIPTIKKGKVKKETQNYKVINYVKLVKVEHCSTEGRLTMLQDKKEKEYIRVKVGRRIKEIGDKEIWLPISQIVDDITTNTFTHKGEEKYPENIIRVKDWRVCLLMIKVARPICSKGCVTTFLEFFSNILHWIDRQILVL